MHVETDCMLKKFKSKNKDGWKKACKDKKEYDRTMRKYQIFYHTYNSSHKIRREKMQQKKHIKK